MSALDPPKPAASAEDEPPLAVRDDISCDRSAEETSPIKGDTVGNSGDSCDEGLNMEQALTECQGLSGQTEEQMHQEHMDWQEEKELDTRLEDVEPRGDQCNVMDSLSTNTHPSQEAVCHEPDEEQMDREPITRQDFQFKVPDIPVAKSKSSSRQSSVDSSNGEWMLDTLPAELFLHICSYLEAKFVIRTLSLVCRYFHNLIHDNMFWKVRIAKRWPKKYPAIPVNNATFNWMEACIAREEQWRMWNKPEETMNYHRFSEGIFACVDCVHLIGEGALLAVGSRDHYINILDLRNLEPGNPNSMKAAIVHSKNDAHKGWVWSLSSCDNMLLSGSWDRHLRFWDMAAGAQMLHDTRISSAVLCTHFEHNLVVAGGYDKKVYHIDPRSMEVVSEKRYHTKPVLCMAVYDDYIITGSEDSSVKVYDRRAGKIFKTIKLDSFPLCLSYGQDQLWLGDKAGMLHLLDATDGDFNIVETYDVGHRDKLTGVIHTPGAIFTSSMDKTVRVLEPSLNPGTICTLPQQNGGAVAGLDFKNDILVSANSDISAGIWIPKGYSWT